MIICDANVLLYAYDQCAEHHAVCRNWITAAMNGDEPIGMPWQTLLAFIRITTNPQVYTQPLAVTAACQIVNAWVDRPQVRIPEPGERYWALLQALLLGSQVSGPLVTDAALAALALEQGATLCTTDRDFRRFDALKLINPINVATRP